MSSRLFPCFALLAFGFLAQAQVTITHYPIPGGGLPLGIASDAGGNLWFTILQGSIGKITPSGSITTFPSLYFPNNISRGADGNMWFTVDSGEKIGKITSAGATTYYSVPTPGSFAYALTAGPDGNIWFTEYAGRIGKITPAGVATEYATTLGAITGITVGPDSALWFVGGGGVGRITTAGSITDYAIAGFGCSCDITTGPDGNLWTVDYGTNNVTVVNTAGVVVATYSLSGAGPSTIVKGADGNLWATESNVGKLARITTAGVVTEYIATGVPYTITNAPDGSLWFTDPSGSRIGKAVIPTPPCIAPSITSLTASPNSIRPPNGKMVPVTLTAASSGGCGTVSYSILSVTANEPIQANDFAITGPLSLNVRADRLGNGNGRVYTITVKATDSSANTAAKTVTVTVPHDQR